ncbi:hypothetical protein [Xanthomonas campestris]|uniref:hypothetical protein n=1 Tax=Xanthomonas campestris TaxID=339 RepID=UPI003CE9E46C
MNKLKLILIFITLFGSPVAYASDEGEACIKKGVVVVEVVRGKPDGDPGIIINGVAVSAGKELSIIRNSCSKYMIVMISPKASMRDFINFGFLASKSGFYESSDRYLPFAYSSDKTRMTYLKSMAVIKFTNDPGRLEEIAEAPPTKSNFL